MHTPSMLSRPVTQMATWCFLVSYKRSGQTPILRHGVYGYRQHSATTQKAIMDSGSVGLMSIGNAILDSGYKELHGFIVEIDSAIKAREHSALSRAVRQLSACMNRNFLNEELLANSLHIPFGLHKTAHQNMRDEMVLIRHQITKDGVVTMHMEHYAQFLQDWLNNHLADENTQLMKSALQSRPYDFKVDGMAYDPDSIRSQDNGCC